MHAESKRSGAKDTSSFSKHFNLSIIKLTGIYVVILASILCVSSGVLYSVFSARLEHRFARPPVITVTPDGTIITNITNTDSDDVLSTHTKANVYPNPDDVRSDLINLLVLVNGFLLIIAGGLSYKLAEWTLYPLKYAYERERRFLGDASHELRTPLSILKMQLENELSEKKTATAAAETKSNLEEVNRMSNIISDLLTLSRLTEGTLFETTKLTLVNLNSVIAKTNERLSTIAKNNEVRLVCMLPERDIVTRSNHMLIEAIILNGIKNAITYNKPNGSVTTTLSEGKGEAVITIVDTGIGMTKEDTGKVFDRFFRVDKSRSRQTGGSGLGLSIIKSAIDSLGGRVAIDSVPDKGTTLTFHLPIRS